MSEYSQENLSSGPSSGTDPTLVHGQYPPSLFGAVLPQTTGAPGSAGASAPTGGVNVDFTPSTGQWQDRPSAAYQLSGPGDSTTLASQSMEGISGLGPADITHTGAGSGSVSTPHHPTEGSGLPGRAS